MKGVRVKKILWFAVTITAMGMLGGCGEERSNFLKEHTRNYTLSETVKRFTKALAPKRYTLAATIDHEADAVRQKRYLQPTLTLEISNDIIDTKLLSCNPTMALELPLRVTVYNELNGTTHLVYTNPEYWSLKHNIRDKDCIQLILIMARDLDIASDTITKKSQVVSRKQR
jgi:uncharacterized protein (DUF302 family)